ncbi:MULTISPECIES: DUF7525 family protein [Saliphagus]|uniref:Uncharacterized protein n=1 Tax=Saliphagus infecundisoli TaxID=1849069 RepID=A0ABD5QJV8_9EURY|nr:MULTISPECIES: hypothetical protein [Saliphagus]
MAVPTETTTDKGTGLAVVFGVLAALGAVGMAVLAPSPDAGLAFAAAVAFGSIAVVGIHLWE